jgi:LuxR family maltose regulon positive regulatory protein
VSGRADADAALDRLYRRNVFVVALDDQRRTLRFHELFRDFLRARLARLDEMHLRDLHRRAALALPPGPGSIRHGLAAQLWDEAARRIEACAPELIGQGALNALRGWIDALPERVRAGRPRLQYVLGLIAWTRRDLDRANTLLRDALEVCARTPDHECRGEVLAILGQSLALTADFEGSRRALDEALGCDLPAATRARLFVQQAWLELAAGEWAPAVAALDSAVGLAASGGAAVVSELCDTILCHFVALPGAIDRIERFCALAAIASRQSGTTAASVRSLRAWTLFWRGSPAEARAEARGALEIGRAIGGVRWVEIDAGLLIGMHAALAGDEAGVGSAFATLLEELDRPEAAAFARSWRTVYLFARARALWLRDRLADAWAVEAAIRAQPRGSEWRVASACRAVLRGMLHLAAGRHRDAEPALREAAALQRLVPTFNLCDDARLLLAKLFSETGRERDALLELDIVLGDHERQGTPGALLWHGRALMLPLLELSVRRGVRASFAAGVLRQFGATATPEPRAVPVPATGETLTAREIEVLRLLAAGASNSDIAARLFISGHTVKRHVANLLQKLDASSRTQAAARGREMGLL